jgi:hypothetical protein
VFRTGPDGFTGEFIIDKNNDGIMDAGDESFGFGIGGDRIAIGDWTGDGKDKIAVFRSTGDAANTAVFTEDTNNNHNFDAGDKIFNFGIFTDGIVVGDWNGNGIDKLGVYRDGSNGFNAPGVALWSLDTNGNGQFDPSDEIFLFGLSSDQFVAGNWPLTELAATTGPGAAALTPDQLAPIFNAAVNHWAATGLSPDQVAKLSQTQVNITNLPGNELGEALPGTILLSADAAGNGWFVDPQANPDPNKIDLLTVMEHELGHETGLPDDGSGGVMDGVLPTGVRRTV